MMEDYLIKILEKSIKKDGERPLTNKELLTMIKKAIQMQEREDYYSDMIGTYGDITV